MRGVTAPLLLMGCLNDIYCGNRTIIGIKDYKACLNPESGLFINSLPGMSLKTASAIANEEYHSGSEFMHQKIKDATKIVVNEFTNIIAGSFDFNSILIARELSELGETSLPAVAKNRGLVLKRWRSEMAHIFIEFLPIKVVTGGVATIRIIDGDITKEFTATLESEKVNKVFINYKCESEQVRIEMDNTNFQVFTGPMHNSGGCGSCSKNSDLYIIGWDGQNEQSTYYGMGVSASVRCYEENAICKLLSRMYFLIWYRSGIEILNEGIYGTRMNNIVTMGKDKMKEQKALYEEEYKDSIKAFQTNIKVYLRSLRADCVTCNSNHYAQTTP